MAAIDLDDSRAPPSSITSPGGRGALEFVRSGERTVLRTAFATTPLRFLTPRNHGNASWVFLASLGGGLVGGDAIDVRIDVAPGATALVGTQASTKIYRSPRGCSQRLRANAHEDAAVVLIPDPVVCFAGASYRQRIEIELAAGASLFALDATVGGRTARGERWQFDELDTRTTIARGGRSAFVDATRLTAAHGRLDQRMGRFNVLLSVIAMGPRFEAVRDALLSPRRSPSRDDSVLTTASPVGKDGAVMRVAAECFEAGSSVLRSSFAALSRELGDDPFARKW
jgi:urease accessory protein